MKRLGLKYYVSIMLILASCHNEPKNILFPENENEFAPPLIKKLGKPQVIKVKPLVIPLGIGRPDSIKPPEIVKLGKPKIVPFITNEKPLGKPDIVPFKQPDTIYYFSEKSKYALLKKHSGKVLVKVQEPVTKKIRPKIVLLGQPEKVICKPAQMTDNAITNLRYYNQDQGLPATIVRCICCDRKGNIWVGTDGGLCKFDGKEWWIYTVKQGLSHNYIYSLLESSNGNLLIGTYGGGLNVLDYKNQSIKHFTMAQGLSNNFILSLVESRNGNFVLGTLGGGLNVLDINSINPNDQSIKIYNKTQGLNNNYILSLLESKDGNLLIGTSGGLNVLDDISKSHRGQSLKHYSKEQGLNHNHVYSLLEDRDGNLLIGTEGDGLCVLNPGTLSGTDNNSKKIKRYSTTQGLSNNKVVSLLESCDGNLLIGTEGGGLCVLNNKNQSLKQYGTNQGLSDNDVISLMECRDGNLLIGTLGGGLNVFDNKSQLVEHYRTTKDLSNNSIYSLLESQNGNLLLGTVEGGLKVLDNKNQFIEQYSTAQGLSNNGVFSLLKGRNGKLLIGTSGSGLNILDNNPDRHREQTLKRYSKAQGLNNNLVLSLLESSDGRLLIGTYGGLNVLEVNPESHQDHSLKHFSSVQGLSNNIVFSLLESREGKLLIGTYGGGLNILDASYQNLSIYSKAQGLNNDYILSILESREGYILIGTDGSGLIVLDPGVLTGKNHNLKNYGLAQGLPNEQVFSIKEDTLGNLWLGTGDGLCKLIKKNGVYVVQKNFDKREGLKYMDFNPNSMCLTQQGKLYAGIGEILSKFNPYTIADTVKPITYITAIDVSGKKNYWLSEKRILQNINSKDTIWSSSQETFYVFGNLPIDTSFLTKNNIYYTGVTQDIFHLPIGLILPFRQNHLTFYFNSIYVAPNLDRIRYRYILDGQDAQWSPITEKSEADYRNIPPGNYIFKVAARSINGYWSKPVEFAFEVLPPWYQTYWAYLMYVIIFFAIVFGYSYWRQKNIRRFSKLIVDIQEEEKMKISRELHDDLGQQLSFFRINYALPEEAKKTIDNVLEKIRNISYDLRPIKIYKDDIKTLLENLTNGVKSEDIYFSYEIEQINNLSQDQKVNIYRITQEAINNILKHSNAKNARITLLKQGEELVLEIMDDGVGFKIKDKYNSVGLFSMKERAKLLNATLEIKKLEKGTKIILTLKHGYIRFNNSR